jgi:iron complex outermembrane recepter protein
MRRPFALALVASASMLPLAAPALAQEEEEIVVTAQKREELLREVPQSVTAVTAETFERLQANNLQDYVGRIPGMVAIGSTGQPGTSGVTLRGISAGGGTASTATYVDETPYGFSGGLGRGAQMTPDLDPFDLARLEVLRGPQGTLYGASAMGGVIKFVTQDPAPGDFSAALRGSAEHTEDGDSSYTARAAFNIPLGDQAGLRISGFRRDEGGYIDDVTGPPPRVRDDVNGSETEGFRAKFLLHATDNLTFRISTAQQEFSANGDSGVSYNQSPFILNPGGPNPESVPMPGPSGGSLEQDRQQDTPAEVIYRVHNATIDWDLGWASLLSSTSFSEFEQATVSDASAAFGPSFLSDAFLSDKTTQELRLASPGVDEGLDWLVGLYYTDENGALIQDLVTDPPGGPVTGGVNTLSDYTETAAFATVTYHFSPQFDVSGGVRYAQSDATVSLNPYGFFAAFVPTVTQDISDNVTTWSASARWRPSDRTMVYTRVATGWRAGGPNIPLPPLPAIYEADTLTNYEIGLKSDIIDNLLRLDIAAFRIDWEDMHVQVLHPAGIGGNGNADTATSQGVEWEAILTPLDGLTMRWSGAYTNAELTADAPLVNGLQTLGPQAVDGAALPDTPEWATTLSADYEWTAFGDATAYVGGDVRYTGERLSGFTVTGPAGPARSRVELPNYTIVDLRAGVDFERFGLEFFARNVGNDDTPTSFGGALGATNATVTRPRTIGLSVSANF